MVDATPTFLTLTDGELAALQRLGSDLSDLLVVAVILETCAEDGDEWAALALADGRTPWNEAVLATVQLVRRPARGYAILRPDGGQFGAPTQKAGYAGNFRRVLHYVERLALREALAVRSRSHQLAALMPKAQDLHVALFPLSRAIR